MGLVYLRVGGTKGGTTPPMKIEKLSFSFSTIDAPHER